jgi:hypothetical protein
MYVTKSQEDGRHLSSTISPRVAADVQGESWVLNGVKPVMPWSLIPGLTPREAFLGPVPV